MTDTVEPARLPTLGETSNLFVNFEWTIAFLHRAAAMVRVYSPDTGAADCIDGAANATSRALDQLRYDMRDVIYDCERDARPYNRSEGA